MKPESVIKLLCTLIALMFFYAALSKLMDYDRSRSEMLAQIFSYGTAEVLVWLVPATEMIVTALLLFNPTRLMGLYCAAVLMIMFSLYIAVSMSGVFGKIPCSCGGILRHMGYWMHLVFNITFLALAVIGIRLDKSLTNNNVWATDADRKPVKNRIIYQQGYEACLRKPK